VKSKLVWSHKVNYSLFEVNILCDNITTAIAAKFGLCSPKYYINLFITYISQFLS